MADYLRAAVVDRTGGATAARQAQESMTAVAPVVWKLAEAVHDLGGGVPGPGTRRDADPGVWWMEITHGWSGSAHHGASWPMTGRFRSSSEIDPILEGTSEIQLFVSSRAISGIHIN